MDNATNIGKQSSENEKGQPDAAVTHDKSNGIMSTNENASNTQDLERCNTDRIIVEMEIFLLMRLRTGSKMQP